MIRSVDSFNRFASRSEYSELTNEEKQMVKLCKRVRALAQSNKFRIDKSSHYSSDNKHLFHFIELCCGSLDQFLYNYLSKLQPYDVVLDKAQSNVDDKIYCILQLTYRYSMYIKIDITQYNELLISFHEDQNRKQAIKSRCKLFIADCVNNGTANISFCLGFKVFNAVFLWEHAWGEIVAVNSADVTTYVLNEINALVNEELGVENFNPFRSMSSISFSSYGYSVLNKISLLLDCIDVLRLPAEKSLVLSALDDAAHELNLLEDSTRYWEALTERYSSKISRVDQHAIEWVARNRG